MNFDDSFWTELTAKCNETSQKKYCGAVIVSDANTFSYHLFQGTLKTSNSITTVQYHVKKAVPW